MNNRDKPWWDKFLSPGDRERIDEAIRQQLSNGRTSSVWRTPDSLRDVKVNPDIVIQQQNCITELATKLGTLNEQIRRGLYYQRPCSLGTKLYCIVGKSVVKGYVHSYEDMFNIQNKAVIRVIKIALIDSDGIIHKALNEFGKTVFLNEAEALSKVK